jgi:hypothetical protein
MLRIRKLQGNLCFSVFGYPSHFRDSIDSVCTTINTVFELFINYFHFPVLVGLLPLTIMVRFSFPTFLNVRTLASRQMNIMRLSRDRQLTAMTLIQVTFINEYICGLNIQSTDMKNSDVTKGRLSPTTHIAF